MSRITERSVTGGISGTARGLVQVGYKSKRVVRPQEFLEGGGERGKYVFRQALAIQGMVVPDNLSSGVLPDPLICPSL